MHYLIIDDEPIAHRIIDGYCSELAYLKKAGGAYTAFEASAILDHRSVGLIFLDINMPKLSGFEWLKTLSTPPAVIVTTAHEQYALEGFELSVVDYLLKPFSFARFLTAINKVTHPNVARPEVLIKSIDPAKGFFFVKGDKKHHQIDVADILFIEAFGNYTKLYLPQEVILVHEKISDLEAKLANHNFLRVHKSFLIAIHKIKLVEGNTLHVPGYRVPVGQTYRSRITELLKGR